MKTESDTATSDTGTDYNRFKDAVRQIMSVPKKEIDRREAQYQKNKSRKKNPKPKK